MSGVHTDRSLRSTGLASHLPQGRRYHSQERREAHGALYTITKSDEAALDRYEGYRESAPLSGAYRKVYLEATVESRPVEIMFYVMNSNSIAAPSDDYYEVISDGFVDWGLATDSLAAARKEAHGCKNPETAV